MEARNQETRSESQGQREPSQVRDVARAWQRICALDDIVPGSAVAAWFDGEQVALVRPTQGSEVFAISNFDPFSQAYVMARGIVGDRAGVLKIASPIFKQSFSLETGECLDDAAVGLSVYPVRVLEGVVFLAERDLS